MSQSSKLVTLANRLTALEKTAYPFGHGGPPRHVEDYEADGMDRRTMTAFDKAEITLPECIGDIKALVRAL